MPRLRLWSSFALFAALVLALTGGLGVWIADGVAPLVLALVTVGLVIVAVGAFVWLFLDWSWIRPANALAREIELLVHAEVDRVPEAPRGHGLGPLPGAIRSLAERYRELRRGQDAAREAAVARAAEQQSRLEAILRDLGDGVIGCSADRRILLFNEAARRILDAGPELGLDRPLDALIAREPIGHAFALLRERHGEDVAGAAAREAFVCASADGSRLLRCRMSLITDADDGSGPSTRPTIRGFVLDFVDATERLGHGEAETGRVERLVEALRGPAAALGAAADVLRDPGLADDDRQRFVGVVARESERLGTLVDELAAATRVLASGDWPMADLFSADLARRARRRLEAAGSSLALTEVGQGLWLHGDGHHLALAIERLAHQLHEATGAAAFDLEARESGRRVELDLVWTGAPVPNRTIEGWLDAPLDPRHGAARLRDVLRRHDSEVWSQAHAHAGRALLRLPLPPPERPQLGATPEAAQRLPPRPEFYDFALLDRRAEAGSMLEQRLRDLAYVVFDAETTGLDPAKDDIVQLAAVRIVNRRLLSGETFERLIDPRRPIPKASTRFHGITDTMVRGRPPIEVVLPQFRRFADGAVLVAHNAAFDVAFLRRAEATTGIRFEQPVLDTLLLSVVLHDHTSEHALEAIAERFGVALVDRHRALGDALGTAGVFLGMLDLLEARGISTLGDALDASERALAVRRRQVEAFGGEAPPRPHDVARLED